jgi:hypothetical protein
MTLFAFFQGTVMTSASVSKPFHVGKLKHKPSVAIVDTRLKIRNMYLCYKQKPCWMVQKTRDNKSWEAVDIPETDSKLRNHIFQSLDEVQQLLDPSASSDPSCSFFLTDKSERIITDLKMSDFYPSPQTTSKKATKRPMVEKPLQKVGEKITKHTEQESKHEHTVEPVKINTPSKPRKKKKESDDGSTLHEPNTTAEQKPTKTSNNQSSDPNTPAINPQTNTNPKPARKRKQDMVSDEPPQFKGKKLPRVTTPSTSPQIKPREPTQEIDIDPIHPRERSMDLVSQHASNPTQPLTSVFKSTQSIQQKYKPDHKTISCVNNYDQYEESFLCRQWMTPDQVERGNSKWNAIASCYAVLYYAHKILKWPLDEVRVVTTYDINAVKLSLVAPQIYKIYDIEHRFEESSALVKLLVYCIASMNSFGIIRPIIFKGKSNQGYHIEKFCASKQLYDRVPYYVSWPWRTTSKNAYILVNRTKMNEIDMDRTILKDLNSELNMKKLLKDIPDWVYGLVKK